MSFNRVLAGKKAQSRGQEFELIVRARCKSLGITYTHHPTGCKPFGRGRFHTIKTGYDFTFFWNKKVCVVDAKALSKNALQKSAMRPHQVTALLEIEQAGFVAGYMIYFKTLHSVYFVKASQMYYLESGSSIPPDDMILLGDIGSFDLTKLFDLPTRKNEIERLVANE
jgi:penicillin-binding protein-related factor A (putative recombinase)